MKLSPLERFESKVDRNGPTPEHCPELGPCWIWRGAHRPSGYGCFWIDGRQIGAHVASYILNVGPVPRVVDVAHTCDRPSCANPAHLFLATRAENMQDAKSKGRLVSRERRDIRNADLARIYLHGYSCHALGRMFHIRPQAVANRIKRLGVELRESSRRAKISAKLFAYHRARKLPLAA